MASIEDFTVDELVDYLEAKGVSEGVTLNFKTNRVSGAAFLRLTEDDLRELAPLVGERTNVRELLKQSKQETTLNETGESSTDRSSGPRENTPLQDKTNNVTMPQSNKVPTNWHLSFKIPQKHTFSGVVQKAVETGVVCAKARRDIVQTLRTLILQHTRYPSSEEYTTVSRKLVEQFPKLHDGGTSGFGSWKLSLRTAFKNFRRDRPDENGQPTTPTTATGGPPSKRIRVTVNDSTAQLTQEEYEDAVMELKHAYRGDKKKRNYAKIKLLMESTQPQRREWILEKRPLVAEIIEKFPFLSSNKTLRREFRAIAAIDGRATSLMSSWPDWVERLVQFSKAEAATRPVIRKLLLEYEAGAGMDNPTEHSHGVILELLLKLLYPKGALKAIFIKKFEACDIDIDVEVGEIAQSAPYIIQTGRAGSENVQFFIACERQIVCESKSLLDAIIDLIACYYVFDISYPKGVEGILVFFERCVFSVKFSQPLPVCTQKLVTSLKRVAV